MHRGTTAFFRFFQTSPRLAVVGRENGSLKLFRSSSRRCTTATASERIITMSSVCNKNVDKDTNDAVHDKRADMKNNYKESISTKHICPNNYVSAKIKILYLSEDIGYGIVTNAAFKPNETLFEYMIPFSELRNYPDRHSIQVDWECHWCTDKHPMRYILHSCFNMNCRLVVKNVNNSQKVAIGEANGASKHENLRSGEDGDFANFKLVALKQLTAGTVATVNYNSFEWEMSTPFLDSDAQEYSENDKKETKNRSLDLEGLQNVAGGKGREVRGYKFAKPDEIQFLKDRGLILRHIEETIQKQKKIFT